MSTPKLPRRLRVRVYLLGRVVGAAEEDVLLPADGDLHAGRRLRIAHVMMVHDEEGQLLQVLPVTVCECHA